jgi:MoaA/NifB/PqqE/SkfB family radical SAM enzyme
MHPLRLPCGTRKGQRTDGGGVPPIVDQLSELGCRHITFIGGEVFLYHDWDRVAARASESGMEVNIATNGAMMGDREIAQIRRAGLRNVGLSLDGLENTHDRIRNVKGAFGKVLLALESSRGSGPKKSRYRSSQASCGAISTNSSLFTRCCASTG